MENDHLNQKQIEKHNFINSMGSTNSINNSTSPNTPMTLHNTSIMNSLMQTNSKARGYKNLINTIPPIAEFNIKEETSKNKINNLTKNIKKEDSNIFLLEKQKPKSYISYLINTIDNLFKEKKLSFKYLKEKNEPKICENPLCKNIVSSNKEKIKTVIKGLKTQEKILCDNCINAVEKCQFCFYCNLIYREKLSDTAVWIECDYCHKWEHFDCELQKGKRYFKKEDLQKVKNYMCPFCLYKNNKKKEDGIKFKKKFIGQKKKREEEQKKKTIKKGIELRNSRNEKYSEIMSDVQLIESYL